VSAARSASARLSKQIDQGVVDMKVFHGTTWNVKPDRMGDFIKYCAKAAELHKSLGAEDVRLMSTIAGGPQTQFMYVMVVESEEAFGSLMKTLNNSAEWSALNKEFFADPCGEVVNASLRQDIFS
jgi:hypothetical protein|tara:strand:+ start:2084 stop:2458 length:375 start_codon:yes stop_codon:yes gene_type:complete